MVGCCISYVYIYLFQQNIQIDRLEDAMKDFENSISKNPDFPNSYIQKSYAGKQMHWVFVSLHRYIISLLSNINKFINYIGYVSEGFFSQ